jgi:integrase/recombinase XerD
MSFKDYLQQKQYSAATISTYEKHLSSFTDWLERESLHADAVGYGELLGFMGWLQAGERCAKTISMILGVVRHYYDYRVASGLCGHNPAAGVFIKGIVRRLPGSLLPPQELEALYELYRVQLCASLESRVLLGLLVFQGLTVREVRRLETTDVRLKDGTINIRGGRCYNGRRLKLDGSQVKLLDLLLRQTSNASTRRQWLINVNRISHQMQQLLKMLKRLNPAITNAHQLRGSVITGWLKQYNLRQVQYMAGHKYASSTQRYQTSQLDALQMQLQQHHPLETARFAVAEG